MTGKPLEKKALRAALAVALLGLGLGLGLAPMPALAQDDGSLTNSANGLGNLLGFLNGADPSGINLEDACGKSIGCIVIANNSDDYDLVEIDVDVHTKIEHRPRWTNLMNDDGLAGTHTIKPRKVFLIPRIGDDKLAVVGLRAILRNSTTRKRETIELGTIDLRPDPQKRLFVNFLRYAPPGSPGATAQPSTPATAPGAAPGTAHAAAKPGN